VRRTRQGSGGTGEGEALEARGQAVSVPTLAEMLQQSYARARAEMEPQPPPPPAPDGPPAAIVVAESMHAAATATMAVGDVPPAEAWPWASTDGDEPWWPAG
jgi:hypothetical protein